MSERKEYKVGEIFRHDGFTYQCVVDFVLVTEPKEGMLSAHLMACCTS